MPQVLRQSQQVKGSNASAAISEVPRSHSSQLVSLTSLVREFRWKCSLACSLRRYVLHVCVRPLLTVRVGSCKVLNLKLGLVTDPSA